MKVQKIVPSLWYTKDAAAAAKFYVEIFPDSRIDRLTTMPADTPSGPAGSVEIVELTLWGQAFMLFTAGPLDPFNHAISFSVICESQQEIDRYWDALQAGGGKPEQCGWLADRFGVFWQVTPKRLGEMMSSSDRAAAKRATEAMLKMKKLDLAALEAAFRG